MSITSSKAVCRIVPTTTDSSSERPQWDVRASSVEPFTCNNQFRSRIVRLSDTRAGAGSVRARLRPQWSGDPVWELCFHQRIRPDSQAHVLLALEPVDGKEDAPVAERD
jgi:hypothetical protein